MNKIQPTKLLRSIYGSTDKNGIADEQKSNHSLLSDYINFFINDYNFVQTQSDRRELFYRGQSDTNYALNPSVFREQRLSYEDQFYNDILLNTPEAFNESKPIECLIKMQHYGTPTRLLDVTFNPLVALFFACNENNDKDGELFMFYDYVLHPSDENVKCFISLVEYSGSSERQMTGFLQEHGHRNIDLEKITHTTHIPTRVPLNNERIKRQQGAFIIFGFYCVGGNNPYEKSSFDLKDPEIMNSLGGTLRSSIIPKDDKGEILRELETLGINQSSLFPELEHQATYLRTRH